MLTATAASNDAVSTMIMTTQKPIVSVGGKHSAMWQRMKAKNANTKTFNSSPMGITMAVTMDDNDDSDDNDENDNYNDDDNNNNNNNDVDFVEAITLQDSLNISAWAMMDLDSSLPSEIDKDMDPLLGTSLISSSTEAEHFLRPRHPLTTTLTPDAPTQRFSTPSMFERNQTLVKEVKFAEQTCVELSQRNASLEQQVERLEAELLELRTSDTTRQQELIVAHRANATLEAQNEGLQQQLIIFQQRASFQPTDHPHGNILHGSPTSRVLARTLESELAREHAVTDRVMVLERQLSDTQGGLEEVKVLTKERDALRAQLILYQGNEGKPWSNMPGEAFSTTEIDDLTLEWRISMFSNRVSDLEVELVAVREKCTKYRKAAKTARAEVDQTKQRLQEEFYDMTTTAIGQIDRHSQRIHEAVQTKIAHQNDRLLQLTSLVEYLKSSLDFQSESVSANDVSTDDYIEVNENDFDAVLDATFHKPSVANRLFDDECLLEQMEEARLCLSNTNEAIWGDNNSIEGSIVALEEQNLSRDTLSCYAIPDLNCEAATRGKRNGTLQIDSDEVDKRDLIVEELKQRVITLTVQVNQVIRDRDSLQNALEIAEADFEHAQFEISDFKASNAAMEKSHHSVAMLEIEVAVAKEEKRTMSQALYEKDGELNSVKQENTSLRNKIQIANTNLAEKVDLLQQVEKERSLLDEARVGLSVSLSDLLDQGKDEISRLKFQLREANRSKEDLISKCDHLSEMWNAEITARKAGNRQFEEQERKADIQLSKEDLMKRRIEELQDALAHSENELEHLKCSYVSCNDKLAAAVDWAEEQQALSEKYKAQYDIAEMSAKGSNIEALSHKNVADALRRTNEELLTSIATLKDDLQHKRKTHEVCQAGIAELEVERDRLRDQCKQLQVSLAQEEMELNSLKNEFCEEREKQEDSIVAVRDSKAECEQLRVQCNHLHESLAKEQMERTSLKNELHEEREKQEGSMAAIKESKVLHEKLKDQCRHLDLSLANKVKMCDALKDEAQTKNRKITELQSVLLITKQDFQKQTSIRDHRVNELHKEMVDSSSRADVQSLKEKNLMSQIDSQAGEMERLSISYVACNDKLAAMSEHNDECLAQIVQLDETIKFLEQRAVGYSNELDHTVQKLEKIQFEKMDLQQRLSRAENELKCNMSRLKEYQETIDNLKSTSATAMKALDEELSSLRVAKGNDTSEITESLGRFATEFATASIDAYNSLRRVGVVRKQPIPQFLPAMDHSNSCRWKRSLAIASEEVRIISGLISASCESLTGQSTKIQELESLVQEAERGFYHHKESKDQLEFDILRERARVSELTAQLQEAGAELVNAVNERDEALMDLNQVREECGEQRLIEAEVVIQTLKLELDSVLENEGEASATVALLTEKLEISSRVLSSLGTKLEESEIMLEEQESASLNLQTQNEALARKCTRLKGYIQKLTSKCDEWASSYDKQARVMQQWMPIS